MAFSYYLNDILFRHLFKGETLSPPMSGKTAYLALYFSYFPSLGGGTELSGNNYARKSVTFSWSPDNNNYIYNNYALSFNTASGTWGPFWDIVVCDASTSGNVLFNAQFPSAVTVNSGQTLSINPWGILFSIHGYNNLATWGGVSWQYSKTILEWIMNMIATIPYPRTYDVAIGRSAIIDTMGRFTSWTECSGTGYTRQALSASDWGSTSSYVYNLNEILFTNSAPDNWGNITHIVLYPTGTQQAAFWTVLDTPINATAGTGVGIGAEDLKITFT